MCLFNSEGLSKALPQTSQGSRVLSPLAGLLLGEGCLWCRSIGSIKISPAVDAPEEDDDSPDKDFLSSVSPPLGGDDAVDEDDVINARDSNDIDKSSGESTNRIKNVR